MTNPDDRPHVVLRIEMFETGETTVWGDRDVMPPDRVPTVLLDIARDMGAGLYDVTDPRIRDPRNEGECEA